MSGFQKYFWSSMKRRSWPSRSQSPDRSATQPSTPPEAPSWRSFLLLTCPRPKPFNLGAKRVSRSARFAPPLDRLHVYRLGALVALLLVVGDLGPLLEAAEAAAGDTCVMDEEVLVAFVGCDEAEALLVAEPLDCSGWHGAQS